MGRLYAFLVIRDLAVLLSGESLCNKTALQSVLHYFSIMLLQLRINGTLSFAWTVILNAKLNFDVLGNIKCVAQLFKANGGAFGL